MAKVGAGAAGLQLSYNESKMPQITQYWGGRGLDEQAKKKAGEAAKQAAKKKKIDEWDKEFKPEDIAVKFSEYGDYDNAVFGLGEEIANRYAQIHRSALIGSDEDKRNARLKMNKLKRAVTMVNTGTSLMGKKFADYQKFDNEGKVSGADRFGRILEPIMVDGRVSLELNEDLVPVVLTVDEEGNQFKVPYTDIVDGSFTHMEHNDLLKDADNMLKQVGTDISKYIGGDRTVELKRWNDRQAATARNLVNNRIRTSPDIMSDYLYQITAKEGEPITKYDDFTEEEYKKVGDFMYDMVKGGYDKYVKETPMKEDDIYFSGGKSRDGSSTVQMVTDLQGNADPTEFTVPTEEGGTESMKAFEYTYDPRVMVKTKGIFQNDPKAMISNTMRAKNKKGENKVYARVVKAPDDMTDMEQIRDFLGDNRSTGDITELTLAQYNKFARLSGFKNAAELEKAQKEERDKYDLPEVASIVSGQMGEVAPSKKKGEETMKDPFPDGKKPTAADLINKYSK